MSASHVLACGAVGLAIASTVVACAASNNESAAPAPSPDASGTVLPDAESPASDGGVDAREDVVVGDPGCSEAGWCLTTLPDEDLMLKDIWPFDGRAIALAESPTLGIKVLEWQDAEGAWTYVDDGTQNQDGFGAYVGKGWAPSDSEFYYPVAPGYVYHGTRTAAGWTWTRTPLPTNNLDIDSANPTYSMINARYPAFGVWGTSASNLYAWYANTIYHWTQDDAGERSWVSEYVAGDPSSPLERLFVLGAAGTSSDDVWFSGARSQMGAGCALVIRRTAAGYQRIADGTIGGPYWPCFDRPGFLRIAGAEGWLTDIQAVSNDQFIALKGGRDVVRISATDSGYSVDRASIPANVSPSALNSLWSDSGNLWLAGWGRVIRGSDVWSGGAFGISTIALGNGPINRPIYQVRGTSNTNLWAIGVRYAFHKTTP
ncbi:hypothetical protein AKJ09_09336 [Labilithrix luteola]|uniref:Type IV fimbrial biogenesis protein PilY1 n=1 Tax=Labilithrix luteola TaxID=1391654 RepID=A0A0K1QAA9_9BACT|nr:hypothetical protein [Labilithrix luteola]AKV02673.1 hypothetical protein AKJ09_09336 [Labilithrix luteola]